MSQHSTLSLVIPAKNEQENIAKLLTEAFNVMRDYPGFEVVLVDDGSSDQTLATARRTAEALGGAGYWRFDMNRASDRAGGHWRPVSFAPQAN